MIGRTRKAIVRLDLSNGRMEDRDIRSGFEMSRV